MGYLSEKAAYLKGLAEGLGIENETKEGKLLNAIIEALDEIALEVDDMVIIQEDMQEQLDEVDEALADLEDDYYALDEDLEEDYDEEFDELDDLDDLDEEWDEEYSFECPKCGDVVYINPELIDDDVKYIVCPNCEEKILLEFDTDNE